MGRPKLSLPLGNRTVLEHVVAALKVGGAERVLVVIGPHVPELVPLAETAGASVCLLEAPTPDMRATVQRGLAWIEKHLRPLPKAFLLAPADHPTLDATVVHALCNSFHADPTQSILIPVHESRRGHPALVAWRHVEGIRALPADRGINSYFRDHSADVREVVVNNPGVLCDLDTPEDYERLHTKWKSPEW